MKHSKRLRGLAFAALVFPYVSTPLPRACLARPDSIKAGILPLSPAPAQGVTVNDALRRTITWDRKEYEVSEGIPVLMAAMTDARTELPRRMQVLRVLGTAGISLRSADVVPELLAQFELRTNLEEKRLLIGCLAVSEDARALPLITRFLEEATEDVSRFQGAYALARWNIRRGVRELFNLLESREMGPDGQGLAAATLKVLQRLNQHKGWGLDEQKIVDRIGLSQTVLHQERGTNLYGAELKKWFSENEHRFPSWKPGDPLPKVDQKEREPEADE